MFISPLSTSPQQLLDVEDLCTRPDERSTMTYVASYFHAFSSMDRQETNARRVAAFADVMASVWQASNRYEVKVRALLWSLEQLKIEWGSSPPADSYADVKLQSGQLAEHKKTTKRTYVSEKADCTALFGNIQTKLKTYKLRPYDPPVGVRLVVGCDFQSWVLLTSLLSRILTRNGR